MNDTKKVIIIIPILIHHIVLMNNPTKKNLEMFLMGLTVIISFAGFFNLDLFTLPINPEPDSPPSEISLSVVDVVEHHDLVTLTLVGPDGNLKDIRTTG